MDKYRPLCACCGADISSGIHSGRVAVQWSDTTQEFEVVEVDISSYMCPSCNEEAPYCEWKELV